MTADKHWDVFVSYSSTHSIEAERLARRLEDEAKLKVFLDKWRIAPGQPFVPELDRALRESGSCVILIGPGATRPWQNEEMRAALSRAVNRSSPEEDKDSFRVIPVLLPGASDPTDEMYPSFIMTRSLVDFRCADGLDDKEAFARLVAGIRGVAPGRSRALPAWLTILEVPDLRRPTGLAIDNNVLFIADHKAGTVTRLAGDTGVKRQGGLLKPHHLIVMNDGIVATDTHHNELVFFDSALEVSRRVNAFGDYRLQRPHGLASNYPNEFYLTDADNHRVLQIRADAVVAAAGRQDKSSGSEIGEFSVPCGVAAAPDCVYVADTYNHRVQVLTRDLRALSAFGTMGYDKGQFAYPVAVASWHEWIVVADEHNKRLQLWRRDTMEDIPFTVTCISSDLCGEWLGSPFGLTFDEDGRLFVADRKRGNILRINFDSMVAALEKR